MLAHGGGLAATIVPVAGRVVATRILPLGETLSGVFQTLAFAGRFEDVPLIGARRTHLCLSPSARR